MGRFFNIISGLQERLDSVPNHPKIVYDNDREYNPKNGKHYWVAKLIPLRSELTSTDGMQKHTGTYRITVFVENGIGTETLFNDMDAIADTFKNETIIQNGTKIYINSTPPSVVTNENSSCKGYVEIEYMCYSL